MGRITTQLAAGAAMPHSEPRNEMP
jgi:hypothetical protein